MVKNLESELKRYNEEKQIFENLIKDGQEEDIKTDDIPCILDKLVRLPKWGPKLKEQLDLMHKAQAKGAEAQIVTTSIKYGIKNMNVLTNFAE